MSFRILGTNHTSFTVSDLERSIAFLCDCLGFKVVLKAAGHTLELIEYRAPASKGKVISRPCDTGFVKAISPPVTIDQGPNKGRKVVYVRDWDGITLEFIEAAR